MPILTNQPENINYLQQTGGRMVLKRAPNLMFFLQTVDIPAVQLNEATFYTQLDRIPLPGDILRRSTLDVTFKVDEDLVNYKEILNWMYGLAEPDSYDQYKALATEGRAHRDGVMSDINVIIANSAQRNHQEFHFQDCWPTAIGNLRFTTKDKEIIPLDVGVSFIFRHFTVVS
jgi:hypothetical protein